MPSVFKTSRDPATFLKTYLYYRLLDVLSKRSAAGLREGRGSLLSSSGVRYGDCEIPRRCFGKSGRRKSNDV